MLWLLWYVQTFQNAKYSSKYENFNIFLPLCFLLLLTLQIGHIRDFLGQITGKTRYQLTNKDKPGYAVLLKSWESFFTRRLYHRIQDLWNRPISSAPGAYIDVMERASRDDQFTMYTTGNSKRCLNLGSYNYLGFADDWRETCRKDVIAAVEEWPVSMCSSRMDFGSTRVHDELERTVARFIGKEAAIVYTMGFGTNTSTIPSLMGPDTLIVSDSLNHTSIVNGARASPAFIRVFRHNEPAHLEEILREAISNGQPRHHRPWKKIIVCVEGIYSMEGTICKLKEIVRVCKQYKTYIYVDEAHSVGALGRTGRGVCEHAGVDPADIDVLMGTFSKSFSGMGGYIAASKEVITYMKTVSAGVVYHTSMCPIVCQQVLTAFRVIMGEDGTSIGQQKLQRLVDNSNYFRQEMKKIGLHVYGDRDSPIIPVMVYFPAKLSAFSRECLKRGVAVVVVGFPATSVIMSRARFCISAGHTKADLDYAVKVIDEVSDLILLKYNNRFLG